MVAKEINLTTERLMLKGISIADAPAMFKYRSNPQIYKYQSFRPETLEEVEQFIRTKVARVIDIPETWYQVGIYLCKELIGDVGIHFIADDNSTVEIGYTLDTYYQGKGYATEAVTAIINIIFTQLNKHRIIASVDPDNIKSIALLERIGMRKEAHCIESLYSDGRWVDDVVYGMLYEEWVKK